MSGIIGKKVGMTSVYDKQGRNVACTLIEAGPCVVTQVKSDDTDGYNAVQLGFGERKQKRTNNALQGHFKKANTTPKKKLIEFRNFVQEYGKEVNLGDAVSITDVFEEGDFLDIVGKTKGKGFQGVVKRHGFAGVNDMTHGQHDRQRAPGAIGGCSFPARVFKGLRMAGRMGGKRVKHLNAKVLKILPEKNLVLVSGPVPGSNDSIVILEK